MRRDFRTPHVDVVPHDVVHPSIVIAAAVAAYADGFTFGMAVVAVSLLAIRSRSLPRPLVWLGFVAGGSYLVNTPVQLAISQSAGGITGPIGAILSSVGVLRTPIRSYFMSRSRTD